MARLSYRKGCHFIAAAILLREHEGDEYVVLHLLCQGIEIILKALLLSCNYAKYQPLLKDTYRHDLRKLMVDAQREFRLHPLRPAVSRELDELNKMYAQHVLRYGLVASVFIDPSSISNRLILRRALAVIRLANREFARADQ